jgi:hypothetical protein
MKYDYDKDIVLGQKYEDKFKEHLIEKGVNPDWIEQAPKDSAFSDWDIKVKYPILYNEWGEKLQSVGYETYEIKRDRVISRTGNICIEMMSCKENNSLGWFKKTKAQYLIIFDTEDTFYAMKMGDLRNAWINYPQMWTKKEIQQDSGYHTVNWVASITLIPHTKRSVK